MPDASVYVINLPRDTARRASMEAQLTAIGMSAEFVQAVDGSTLSSAERRRVDPARCSRVYGGPMLANEIGCYLSHYRLYERIVAENLAAALILEDDARLHPVLPAIVAALLAMPGWEVVRLATLRPKIAQARAPLFAGRRVADLPGGAGLYRLGVHVLGAAAYLIRRQGAARMVEYGRDIFMPIDQTMDRFWENGIAPFVVRPFPAEHGVGASSIGERPPSRHRRAGLRAKLRFRVQRWRDGVGKRLYRWRHRA